MELVAGWVFAALRFSSASCLPISFPYISAFTLSSPDSSCYTRSNAWSTRTLSIPALTFELPLLLISVANYHAQSYFIGMFVILDFMYSGYASLKPKIIFKIW